MGAVTSCTEASRAFTTALPPNSLRPRHTCAQAHIPDAHLPGTPHEQRGDWLTRSVLAVGEGEAGGESDVDFLLLGNSLLRV